MKENTEEVVLVSGESMGSPYTLEDDASRIYENTHVEMGSGGDTVPENEKDAMTAIQVTVYVPIADMHRRTIESFVDKNILREKLPYERQIRCRLPFQEGCKYIKKLVHHKGMMHVSDIAALLSPKSRKTVERMLNSLLESGELVRPFKNGVYMTRSYLEMVRRISLDTTAK